MIGHFVDSHLVSFRVADDAALTNIASAHFELRLDQDHGLRKRRSGGEDGADQEGGGDERNVHDEESGVGYAGLFNERAGREETRVGAFKQADAGVVAELHRDLSEAGIDGGYVGRSSLQQAIGESSGGGSHIEARSAGYIDVPVIERAGEFQASAADEGQVFAEDADGRGFGNRGSRLVDFLFVSEYPAGEDHGACALAAGNEASFDQKEIDTCFAAGCHFDS